jgi:uncharacterized protein YggE
MRPVALLCLATLALSAPCLARLPDMVTIKKEEKLADGITLSASGVGGRFVKHTLTLNLEEKSDNATAQEVTDRILARQKVVVAAMEALGLTFLSATPPSSRPSGLGGFGGGFGDIGNFTYYVSASFRLPTGACDGETLAGHSRKKVVEAAVKAGAMGTLTLISELDPKRQREDYRESLEDAVKSGRENAAMLAKAGGVTLGRLQAIRAPVGYGLGLSSPRYLTLTATETTPVSGQTGGMFTTLELRFTIK